MRITTTENFLQTIFIFSIVGFWIEVRINTHPPTTHPSCKLQILIAKLWIFPSLFEWDVKRFLKRLGTLCCSYMNLNHCLLFLWSDLLFIFSKSATALFWASLFFFRILVTKTHLIYISHLGNQSCFCKNSQRAKSKQRAKQSKFNSMKIHVWFAILFWASLSLSLSRLQLWCNFFQFST
jgi:hypothetical protein